MTTYFMDSASSSGIEDGDDEINSLYFEIRSSSDFGRYLVAKEDIDEKTLLISEKPIVYGPTDDKELTTDTVFIFCLACCKQIFPSEGDSDEANRGTNENNIYNCSRCGWPVCDNLCERTPIHSENECKIFSHLHIPYPPPHKWLMYKSVILLRLLLLIKREPALWQDFLEKLEHHTDTRKNKANCVRADEIVLENLQYFIQSLKEKEVSRKIARKYRLPYSQDRDVLQRLIGILNDCPLYVQNSKSLCTFLCSELLMEY
ncbi:hypothetical protein Ocin01_11083 [Orchesella cincta]|uniref:Protein msta n=1 Tax=Orchesella cincta TaxID=48709 RepID=A0A1D2MS96_ORCCI|nr:hypothetical protein Ocin01_11083 [Orchesella cincta]